jgi:hypothetical protein
VIAHLLVAAACLASLLFVTVAAHLPKHLLGYAGISGPNQRVYFRFLLFTGAVILLVLISGTSVTGARAGLACADWPLCQGEIFPPNPAFDMVLNLLHRFTVVAAGVGVAGIVLQTRRCYPQHKMVNSSGFLVFGSGWPGRSECTAAFPRLHKRGSFDFGPVYLGQSGHFSGYFLFDG